MRQREYRIEAERTLSDQFHLDTKSDKKLLHGAIGIITELAELSQGIESDDTINIGEELADILWYLSIFERELDFELEEIESENDISNSAAEILDIFKKKMYYNKSYNVDSLKKYCNGVFSGVKGFCTSYNLDINKLRQNNIDKLKVRFPNKFTSNNANNRNLDKELKELKK